MAVLVLVGRILFSLIFLLSSIGHFSEATIQYAAAEGVPFAKMLVPFSGLMALIGALSVASGFRARIGAWLLVLFLVPVTFMMHDFWNIADPAMRQIQQVNFMKNLSMLGASLVIAYFGSGPYSLSRHAEISPV